MVRPSSYLMRHIRCHIGTKDSQDIHDKLTAKLNNISKSSCYTIAFQFSQGVVPFLASMASISKPELFNWKLCLVSEETAVFTPDTVIFITVTTTLGLYTRVVYPACALATTNWCSTPIGHLCWSTWHPPSKWFLLIFEQTRVTALILDKLFAVWGDFGEIRQLRQVRSGVMNVT